MYCLIYTVLYSWCAKTTRARKTNAQERTWAEGRWLCAEEKKADSGLYATRNDMDKVSSLCLHNFYLSHFPIPHIATCRNLNLLHNLSLIGKQTYRIQFNLLFLSFKSKELANQVCWLKYGRWLEKAGLNWLEAFSVVVVLHASWLVLPQGNSFW